MNLREDSDAGCIAGNGAAIILFAFAIFPYSGPLRFIAPVFVD